MNNLKDKQSGYQIFEQTDNAKVKIFCPHCLAEYNFNKAKPRYKHSIKNFDEIFYVALCGSCWNQVNTGKGVIKKHSLHQIGKNIFSNPDKWLSVTTEVAMVMNDHSFSDALMNGHGLSRVAYNAVKQGTYWKLPFANPSLMMIWT